MPRVLVINPNHEDYLTDGLFHGLRTLLGRDAIDFPKAEFLYDTASAGVLSRVRGGAFTLYGLLEDIAIDRDHMLPRALAGEFDLVVFGDIWRTFGLWTEWAPQLSRAKIRLAVIDGSDRVEPYPYAGLWWRSHEWWTLPRAHTRALYFKREITPWIGTFRTYLTVPPPFAARLPSIRAMRPISFSVPAQKVVSEPPAKDRLLASHVVDPEVAQRLGAQTSHAFEREEDYYADLQRSRFGITTKRAGWDCLRHYEQAANGCVPCFRDLDRKPARCAPHGLDESNCVIYRDADELLARLEDMPQSAYRELQEGALSWVRENTTVARARQFLAACGLGSPDDRQPSIAAAQVADG